MPQPAMPHEYGPMRQIWLARQSAPSTKFSFLVRDDASGKSAAQFSKTLRFGDPVSLGPNSTWRQLTWEGGEDQDEWQDRAMFKEATLDGTHDRGKLKLYQGFQAATWGQGRRISQYILAPGTVDIGQVQPLYIAENNDEGLTPAPTSYVVSRYNPDTNNWTELKNDFEAGIRFISRMNDQGDASLHLFVGTADGEFWTLHVPSGAWTKEADDSTYPAQTHCAVVFGEAVYFAQRNKISKRTWVSPGPATYSLVKQLYNSRGISAMTTWNNRIWISANIAGSLNQVLVSDGISVVPAFMFPNEFLCTHMQVHYGSLYFSGYQRGQLGDRGHRGQIWRYNGASLTKLWEEGYDSAAEWGEHHIPYQMASYNQYLVWGRLGVPRTGRKPGLMLYDAELDAIFIGPTWDMDPASAEARVTGITVWADTIVAAFNDRHDYGAGLTWPNVIAFVKRNDSVRHTPPSSVFGSQSFGNIKATREEYLTSSMFDGEVPGEDKVWLKGRLRCKIAAANSSIVVKCMLDGSTTEKTLTTINHDAGNTGWRTVKFDIKESNVNLRSTTIQYKVYIRNSDSGNSNSTANPEVDSIEFDYIIAPKARRQWNYRIVSYLGEVRLDGTANPNDTNNTIQTLWSEGGIIRFWEARSTDEIPQDGTYTAEVWIASFVQQPFRVDTAGTSEITETGISFVENV